MPQTHVAIHIDYSFRERGKEECPVVGTRMCTSRDGNLFVWRRASTPLSDFNHSSGAWSPPRPETTKRKHASAAAGPKSISLPLRIGDPAGSLQPFDPWVKEAAAAVVVSPTSTYTKPSPVSAWYWHSVESRSPVSGTAWPPTLCSLPMLPLRVRRDSRRKNKGDTPGRCFPQATRNCDK